jgi:Flp pilus assembly protein TadD
VGWLWYLITLLPVIGLVRIGPHALADRYTYVPLIGLFIIIAWGVPDLVKGWSYRRTMLTISAGILLCGLMICAWLQVRLWKNSITLFTHAANVTSNNYRAHNNLAVALEAQGKISEAIIHYSESVRIKPNHVKSHNNLGLLLGRQGRAQEAIRHFYKTLRIRPDHMFAHHNLGVALARQGRLKEAIHHFSEAVRIKPDYAEAHNSLGAAFAAQGRFGEAIIHFSEALRIRPDYVKAKSNLDRCLRQTGNSPGAELPSDP